ncbi:zinc-type alcohol dehydrogenase superfamily [Echria macrotheca]|uniref:Zinc-type alcohol dehydrogenase superfamily n=1 Tax=Echria macrotheca TaxID=438768 RepID=A0AAJ0F3U8_9PEZI|nr:zinc-type alcohol dehydrogenase superfamily [Echria macrotheca]
MAPKRQTMRAVVCRQPGPVSVLELREDMPIPVPGPGQVLVKVLAFGINRAEMYTRQGHSPVSFPRILGIEFVGEVAGYPPGTTERPFPIGTKVATCMGGLGRQIPGSYAEYTCVPPQNLRIVPEIHSISTAEIAALPEMLQTTWGSLTAGLDLQPGESLLVRGATSSIGICALQIAWKLGAGRIAGTTRQTTRIDLLTRYGADEVFIDDGDVADQSGPVFDKVLELGGTTTLRDSVKCARPGGVVCMTGIQGGEWEMENFNPAADLPGRVRLCAYSGQTADFLEMPWEELVRDVDEGRIRMPVTTYALDSIQATHWMMEEGGGGMKMVVDLDM